METIAPQRISKIVPEIKDFPDLFLSGNNEEMIGLVRSLRPGEAILDKQYYGAMSQAGLRGVFAEEPKMMEGRLGGVHQAYAGYLVLRSRYDQQIYSQVVVKPFRNEKDCRNNRPIEDLVHELAASSEIDRLYGRPSTFRRLGVASSYDGTPQIITKYDMTVSSLANIFRTSKVGGAPTKGRILKATHVAMEQAGSIVGGLGATHRDFHVGNIARSVEDSAWFNDNETMLLLEQNGEAVVDSELNRRAVIADLNRFFFSAVFHKRTKPSVAKIAFEVFDDPQNTSSMLDAYRNSLQKWSYISGIKIPDRYFMNNAIFRGIIYAATANERKQFGL